MPRIIFKNIDKKTVQALSQQLDHVLAEIIGCPPDWLTFEHLENTIFSQGNDITTSTIYIEISWFKRTQEIQNQLACVLYETLNAKFSNQKEITIIFHELMPENYYENGRHY